ncbi:MAG: hypothetical protein AB1442_16535 [Nitrospirota bacterium]
MLKKPDGETVVVRDPDCVSYPDPSQPYWIIVKEKDEIRTTGEVWVEKNLSGNEVVCEDSVVCTGTRCFHRIPHERTEECGKFCKGADRA